MSEFKIQVSSELYRSFKYDSFERFVSYYYQIQFVKKSKAKKILEIGIGNSTVSNYLKHNGFLVTTCDFDKELNPDCVADVRNLPFEENSFDAIMACEILEHLPFSDFENVLKNLKKISRKNVIISIPMAQAYTQFKFKFKYIIFSRKINKRLFFSIKIPYFYKVVDINKNKQHYWEMGTSGHSRRMVENNIKKVFAIKEKLNPESDMNHYYYLLE